MIDAEYFRRQAERCYRLARLTFDLDLAEKLNAMGDDFTATSEDLEPAIPVLPFWIAKANGRPPDDGVGCS